MYMELVKASSPEKFVHLFNHKIERFENPQIQFVNETCCYIYGETRAQEKRFCCECKNYDWGKGCSYNDGHVCQKDEACEHFE